MAISGFTFRKTAVAPFAFLLLAGCTLLPKSPEPSIVFTRVPEFAEGSSNKLDVIEGRATGARPQCLEPRKQLSEEVGALTQRDPQEVDGDVGSRIT